MADVLSSASLLLAALAMVYTAWQKQLDEALALVTDGEYADLRGRHKMLRSTLYWKSGVLVAASAIASLVHLPPAIGVICTTYEYWMSGPSEKLLYRYDAVGASIVLVTVAFLGLTGLFVGIFTKLKTKKTALDVKKQAAGE